MKLKKIYAIIKITEHYDHIYFKFFEHKEDAENDLKELAKTYSDVKWNKYGDLMAFPDHWTIKEINLF